MDAVMQHLTFAAHAVGEWIHAVALRLAEIDPASAAAAVVALALAFILIATFVARD